MNPLFGFLPALVMACLPAACLALDTGDLPADYLPPAGWTDVTWQDPGGWTTIDVTKQGLSPSTTGDASAKLATIVNGASGNSILYFPPGTYTFSKTITISRSNIRLMGAGPDQTIFSLTSGSTGVAFTGSLNATEYALSTGAARGDQAIETGSASSIRAGDILWLYSKTQRTYFWREGAPELQSKLCYGQIVKATAIAGNRVAIDMKLGVDLLLGLQPHLKVIRPIQNVGIEGIKIDRKQTASGSGNQVFFSYALNGFMKNCESAWSWGPHVEIRFSRDVVITDNYIHHGYDNTGGMNYGINSQDCSTRIRATNNRIEYCRHHLSMKEGANHCVYSYNLARKKTSHTNFLVLHGNYCHNNLMEGNYLENRAVIDGWHNREERNNWFFRNYAGSAIGDDATHYLSPHPACVANETGDRIISNVGTRSKNGTSFVGEFIAANIVKGSPQWGGLTSASRIPPSLYLAAKPSHVSKWPLYGPPTNMSGGTSPANTAPAVSAGPDLSVILPGAASLEGTVSDDGLPSGTVTVAWSKVSGPGTATFASATSIDTTVSFTVAGVYVLRLTASDGSLSASDEMQVVVEAEGDVPGDPIIAEAETATVVGGLVGSSHLGFTGTGYVDYDASAGSYIEWVAAVPAGTYLLDVRYACKDAAGRPLRISVDGVAVTDLAMADTGAWTSYRYSPAVEVVLGPASRIRATALTLGPNIDHLRLTPAVASEPPPPPTEPPADPGTALAVVVVDASADDGNVAANTIDGDPATRWSASGDGQWVRYDLGTTCEVEAVALAVYRGDERKAIIDLQVSADGTTWTTVWSGRSSGTTTALEAIAIPPSATRFVRILGHGNTANLWNSFTEVEIHGVPLPGGAG